VADNLQYGLEIAQRLSPHFDEWRLLDLQHEVTWFKKRLPQRNKYLSRDEQRDAETAIAQAELVVQKSQEYVARRQAVEDSYSEIEQRIADYNHQGVVLERLNLHEFGWFEKVEGEYRKFTRRAKYATGAMSQPILDFKTGSSQLPPQVSPAFDKYIKLLESVMMFRADVDKAVEGYGRLVRQARANISEESPME
jgi:hypothetical protein